MYSWKMLNMFDPPLFKKSKVKDHAVIKEWFLCEFQDWINDHPCTNDAGFSDYHTDIDIPRPYYDLVNHYLRPYVDEFVSAWNGCDPILDWWFAQYRDEEHHHKWHIHPGSLFGVVYQLELPNKSHATEFDGKSFDLDEGDLIIFPAQWPHRSPPGGFGQKTVIAGNVAYNNLAHPNYR